MIRNSLRSHNWQPLAFCHCLSPHPPTKTHTVGSYVYSWKRVLTQYCLLSPVLPALVPVLAPAEARSGHPLCRSTPRAVSHLQLSQLPALQPELAEPHPRACNQYSAARNSAILPNLRIDGAARCVSMRAAITGMLVAEMQKATWCGSI